RAGRRSARRRRCETCSRLSEPVAGAAHGQDQLRLARVYFELLAKVPDVDVDRSWLAVGRIAPDRLEERPAAEDLARLGHERPEQLELDIGEIESAAVHLGLAALDIERHTSRGDRLACGRVAARRPGAAQECSHAAPELADRERLR